MNANATKTLMLVGAHHDDNEGLSGGTIARHKEAGWRVVSVVMTNGRWIRGTYSDEHIEIRNQESREAAELLGMETVFMRFRESGFRPTEGACDALVEQIVKYQPQVIVTHPPLDYHFDHMNTSRCVLDASYLCPGAYAAAGLSSPWPRLYYCEAWFVPFEPDVYVDVTDYFHLKEQARACHKSQLEPEGPSEGDAIDFARARARCRGIESGFKYAEAFRFVPKLTQVRTAELLE